MQLKRDVAKALAVVRQSTSTACAFSTLRLQHKAGKDLARLAASARDSTNASSPCPSRLGLGGAAEPRKSRWPGC